MTSTSRRCTGAGSRWAAWWDGHQGPTPRSDWARSFSPTLPAIIPIPPIGLNRIKAVKEGGIAAVADTVIAAGCPRISGARTAGHREHEGHAAGIPTTRGYLACCEALSTLDQRALLPRIKSPTLVIAGRHDMSTPIAAGEHIRSQIPGRRLYDSRRRAYFQCRTAARLHRRRDRLPDATLIRRLPTGSKRWTMRTPRRRHGPAPRGARVRLGR